MVEALFVEPGQYGWWVYCYGQKPEEGALVAKTSYGPDCLTCVSSGCRHERAVRAFRAGRYHPNLGTPIEVE